MTPDIFFYGPGYLEQGEGRFNTDSIIGGLVKELLDTTADETSAFWWWPMGGAIGLNLDGKPSAFTLWKWRTKRALKKHFDGRNKEVVFPVVEIKIEFSAEYDMTKVLLVGNHDRAAEVPSGPIS